MILEEIWKAMDRFRRMYKVPYVLGMSAEMEYEDAEPTCVYLSTKTLAHLLPELDAGAVFALQEGGTLFGMRVRRATEAQQVPLPFPYIHVTGD